MTALFELATQYRSLESLATSEDLPDEVIRDTLEGLGGEFDIKAVNVAKFILSLDASAQAIEEAADAMALRAARVRRRAESIRAYLHIQLMAVNRQKIETPELVIRRQNNPYSVTVLSESEIPKTYWRQPPAPPPVLDKKAIKEAIQAGADVPGAIIERGEHVRIEL